VHQNLLQGENTACRLLARFVNFTKSTLSEFLHHLVVADLAASFESALYALRRGRAC
jgi:DNA-binding IclR family transcriptional regulator